MAASIGIFFLIVVGLSFFSDFFVKNFPKNLFENLFLRIGIGICLIPFLGVFLNLFHLPIDWKVFLFLALGLVLVRFLKSVVPKCHSEAPSFHSRTGSGRRISLLFHGILQSLSLHQDDKKKRSPLVRQLKQFKRENIYWFFVILMFLASFYMYMRGSFSYDWLEDSDPYRYAEVIKYIAEKKTYTTDWHFAMTAEPRSQGYQILMAILAETNNSISWTLKIFQSLIISFSVPFFYIFTQNLTKNKNIALVAAFFLFSIPAWLTHFIFPFTINMALMLVCLYLINKIEEDKNWKYIFAFSYAGILTFHFQTAVVITMVVFTYALTKMIAEKEFKRDIFGGIFSGIILSLFFWLPSFYRFRVQIWENSSDDLGGVQFIMPLLKRLSSFSFIIFVLILSSISIIAFRQRKYILKTLKGLAIYPYLKQLLFLFLISSILLIQILPKDKILKLRGAAVVNYGLSDFLLPFKLIEVFPNPPGLGITMSILVFFGFCCFLLDFKKWFQKGYFWQIFTLILLFFSLIGILSVYGAIEIVPHRMWALFALPVALTSAYGLETMFKKDRLTFLKKMIIVEIVIISVFFTSFFYKFSANVAPWGENFIENEYVREAYLWLKDELPKNSRVYSFCQTDKIVIGYDQYSEPWTKEIRDYRDKFLDESWQKNYEFLKKYNFQYAIIDETCFSNFDKDKIRERWNEFLASKEFFKPVFRVKEAVIFGI